MYVKKIDWLDEVSKEAIVEVAEGIERLVCFSCPCLYKLNDMLREPLECLDTQDIVSCSTVGSDIKKLEKKFSYKLKFKSSILSFVSLFKVCVTANCPFSTLHSS